MAVPGEKPLEAGTYSDTVETGREDSVKIGIAKTTVLGISSVASPLLTILQASHCGFVQPSFD